LVGLAKQKVRKTVLTGIIQFGIEAIMVKSNPIIVNMEKTITYLRFVLLINVDIRIITARL